MKKSSTIVRTIRIFRVISRRKSISRPSARLSVKILLLKKRIWNRVKTFIDSLGGRDNCIFLHVRRGSPNLTGRRGEKWSYQMVQEYHPLCKKDYYLQALTEFQEDKNVIVVSDLIDWCKRQEWLQG
jgi:hypothetical protein